MQKQERGVKQLFKGIFNYSRELCIEYTYAHTERQAWLVFCRRLAKKHDVSVRTVMGLFDGSKDNFQINIEMEMKETG